MDDEKPFYVFIHSSCLLSFEINKKTYNVSQDGILLEPRIGYGRDHLPDYCLDYFWEIGLRPEDNPERGITKFSMYFSRLFKAYTKEFEELLNWSSFEIACFFNKDERRIYSPRLSAQIELWIKSIGKEPLYTHPLEKRLCDRIEIDNYLSRIIENSRLGFEDFYKPWRLGPLVIYFPDEYLIGKVRDFVVLSESARDLEITIKGNPYGNPGDVITKFAELLGITLDYPKKEESDQSSSNS